MASEQPSQREQLLRSAILAGDEQAWRTCYEEHFDALYGYVLWRTGGRRDWADEIVQETWMVAVRRVRKFDPRQGLWRDWLRGIAANVIRNYLRRLAGREQRMRPLETDQAEPTTCPEIESCERAERISAALASLPEHYEMALRWKYLDQRAVTEIAAESGQTTKAVESLLTRARAMFRRNYEQIHRNGNGEA